MNTNKDRGGHTPGPWSVERVDYELHGMDASYEVTAGRRVVVQTHMREIKSEGNFLAEDAANCRLIAAAPDLLEALEGIIADDNPTLIELNERLEAGRAAISKARGQSSPSPRSQP